MTMREQTNGALARTVGRPIRFAVGGIQCELLSDGGAHYMPEMLAANATADQVRDEMRDRLDTEGRYVAPYQPLLIRAGGKLILVDTGLGELAQAIGEPAGRLLSALRSAGVSPKDIDTVVLTHCHPDHIGGLTNGTANRRIPVFSRASHYVFESEWNFWTDAETLARLPDMLAAPARVQLPPLQEAGLVQPLRADTTVASGVNLQAAPGHTPGHLVVVIEDAGQRAIYAGDAVLDPLNFTHPDWYSPVDAMPEQMVATRRALLQRAARDGSLFLAFHIPPGHVSARGSAFHFELVSAV